MMKSKGKILVVDDNAGIRSALQILLPMHFSDVMIIPSPAELISAAESFRPDAVLLDMNFHRDMNTGNEGLYWLGEIKSKFRDTEVVLFTAYADVALAVEGMKRGAFDFVVKPWENDRLIEILGKACARHRNNTRDTSADNTSGTDNTGSAGSTGGMEPMLWGSSPEMKSIRRTIEKIAPTDASVLITGENGSGKDVLAREIHRLSRRSSRKMTCVDIGAIAEPLFESEMFGHVKGAFTDAKADHDGFFAQADGGTLFLDEIGNIPLHLQAKLLRAIQDRKVTKVGGTKPVPVDIRLICATNMDIGRMVDEGRFREDLWYRINTIHITLPPLRERTDEIIPLAKMFLREFSEKYRRGAREISPAASDILLGNPWRGNVRELRNCIEKAVIMSEGATLTEEDLSNFVSRNAGRDHCAKADEACREKTAEDGQDMTLEMIEERAIRNALKKYSGNLSLVAKSLDISRPTLYSKMKKYGI